MGRKGKMSAGDGLGKWSSSMHQYDGIAKEVSNQMRRHALSLKERLERDLAQPKKINPAFLRNLIEGRIADDMNEGFRTTRNAFPEPHTNKQITMRAWRKNYSQLAREYIEICGMRRLLGNDENTCGDGDVLTMPTCMRNFTCKAASQSHSSNKRDQKIPRCSMESLKDMCIGVIAEYMPLYDTDTVRTLFGCLEPERTTQLSLKTCALRKQSDDNMLIFAQSAAHELVIGEDVTDEGVRIVTQSLRDNMTIPLDMESWEDIDWESVDIFHARTTLRKLVLYRTNISLAAGLNTVKCEAISIEEITLFDVWFKDLKYETDLDVLGSVALNHFTLGGFYSLHTITLSHCAWVSLPALKIWANGIQTARTKEKSRPSDRALPSLRHLRIIKYLPADNQSEHAQAQEISEVCRLFHTKCGVTLNIDGVECVT